MKHLRHLALSVLLVLSLTATALAAEVPVSLVVENLNGQQRIVKTYELPPGTDPETLKEPSFEYDGFSYTWAYTTKDEHTFLETKAVTETVTVETRKKDLNTVLEQLAPSSYQAVATYSASTSSQVATGYVSTAEYKGTVTASGIESITYTVVYVGTEIVPEPPQPTELVKQGGPLSGGNAAAIGGTLLVIALLAALAGGGVWLYLHRKNVYVYVPGDQPRDYKLIAKFRVEPEKPEIQVNEDQIGSAHMLAVEIKKPLAKKLLNQIFTVNHPCGAQRYMVLRDNPGDWHEFPLDNHIEEMEEAT